MGGHTIHRLPNTRDPKWLTFLNSAPRQKTIMGAIGLTFVISGFCCVLTMSQGTHVSIIYSFKFVFFMCYLINLLDINSLFYFLSNSFFHSFIYLFIFSFY